MSDYDLTTKPRDTLKLRKIVRKACVQGSTHKENLCEILRIIKMELMHEFTEDNVPTLQAFFDECATEVDKRMYVKYSNYPTQAARTRT